MKESVTCNQLTCNSPKANSYNPEFMKEAIRIAVENVENGTGGPFGAVVVRNGKIIATSGNTVVPDNDPTAHAEVKCGRTTRQGLTYTSVTTLKIGLNQKRYLRERQIFGRTDIIGRLKFMRTTARFICLRHSNRLTDVAELWS